MRRRIKDPLELVTLWNSGMPIEEIALELDVTESCVKMFAHNHRELCPARRGNLFKEDKLIALWNSGLSIAKIAKELKISQTAVATYASKHRNECPQRTKRTQKINDPIRFAELWNNGASCGEIAEEFGVTESNVWAYLSQNREVYSRRRSFVDHERLVELWNTDMTTQEIADVLGISRSAVCTYAFYHRDLCPKRLKGRRNE